MTDYYVGVVSGYIFSLITLVMMWALCFVSKKSDEGRYYAGTDSEDKYKQT